MDRVTSPDGTIAVDFVAFEMRMSHWVRNPIVRHIPTGDVLLDLTDTMWDADVSFTPGGEIVLDLREYPGSTPGFRATLEPTTLAVRTGAFARGDDPPAGGMTLEDLWRALAPGHRIPEGVRARRRTLEHDQEAELALDRADERRLAEEAERAREAQARQSYEQELRAAEADRQAAAERMQRQREADYLTMRASLERTLARGGAPEPATESQSLGKAAGRFGQSLASLIHVLGSLGLFCAAWWGLSWALTTWTPLGDLPSGLAWTIASFVAAVLLIGVPFGLLMWGFRNYRG